MQEIRWRRVLLVMLASVGISRAVAYSPWADRTIQEPLLAGTLGGRLMPVYALLWLAAGIGCLWHVRRGWIGGPVTLTILLMVAWGIMWATGGALFRYPLWWQTAPLYLGSAGAVLALSRLLHAAQQEITRLKTKADRDEGGADD